MTTPANVHDSQVFKELVDAQDRAVLADSAYHSEEHEAHLLALGAEEFLLRKGPRGQALSAAEQKSNHTISRIRVRVEHILCTDGADGSRLLPEHRVGSSHGPQSSLQLVYNMDRYACLRK
ncbi:MAG: transposase [Chthoniobacter sp.]